MNKSNLGEIIDMIDDLRKNYSEEEVRNMVVYLGDDEELNGVHPCFYASRLDEKDENDVYVLNEIDDKEDKDKGIILFS